MTSRLVKALQLSEYKELTEVLGVGKGTISTWHQRDQTPFEIAVRVHMTTGVSLKWLLLGEGEMYEGGKPNAATSKVELPYFELKNGDLIDKGKMFFDPQFLKGMPEAEHLMLVEHEGQKLFVDTSAKKAVSGKYLINSDDVASIVELQRLPGGKVVVSFNGSNYEVNEADLGILGTIVMVISK